jgi:hypothetical protein
MRRAGPGRIPPLLALALLPVAALAAVAVGERGEPGITAHRLWTFTHLILFVFWLGADLGVVLAVRAAAAAQLSAGQRSAHAGAGPCHRPGAAPGGQPDAHGRRHPHRVCRHRPSLVADGGHRHPRPGLGSD